MRNFAAIAIGLFCVSLGLAQETRGKIFGTVRDPQKATVVGANVTVQNVETNTTARLVTNNTGYYEASFLLPGQYQVTVEAPGFKRSVRSGITVQVSSQVEVDHALELGATSESISVTAEAPMLDTSSVSSGQVMDSRNVSDLPTVGNNSMTMARLAPGVETNGITRYIQQGYVGGSSEFWAAGGQGGNEWSIDGVPNNGTDRRVAATPPTDTLQEFKVETSNFDASIGHTIGVSVSMMTRAGTNDYHGTASVLGWNQKFNAAGFFQKQVYYRKIADALAKGDQATANQLAGQSILPPGHSYSWTGGLGGPIIIPKLFSGKDKLFFYFSYNGVNDRRSADPGTINRTVATEANRNGDFSQLLKVDPVRYQVYDPLSVRPDPARATHYIRTPFTGNILPPSRIANPMYAFYNKRIPLPNNNPLTSNLEPTNNFINAAEPTNVDYFGLTNRVDYNVNDKHRLFFRWSYSDFLEDVHDWTSTTERKFQSNDNVRQTIAATVDWTYAHSASTVINASISGNDYGETNQTTGAAKYKPSDVGLPKYLDDRCLAKGNCAVPRVNFPSGSYDTLGYDASWGSSYGAWTHARTMTVKSEITHIRSSHTLRGGVDLRGHYRTNGAGGGWGGGQYSFTNDYVRKNDDTNTPAGNLGMSWAAWMLGIPTSLSLPDSYGSANFNPYYAGFVQDSWRLTRNFTLNLGLRIEYEVGPTERFDRAMTYFDPKAALPIAAAAKTAYAASPIPELAASDFQVLGGAAYANVNGASRKWWHNELMWLPRMSAAWQFRRKSVLRGGYGMFYDTLNVLNSVPNQTGYSRSTDPTVSTDYGMTWNLGNPSAGVSPLADPFPVRSDGTRYDLPFGSALGAMATAGGNFSYIPYDRTHTRVQRWRLSLQQQISSSMLAEVSYDGSWTDRNGMSVTDSYLPEKWWSTGLVRNNTNNTFLTANVTNPFYIGYFASLQQSNPTLYQNMSTTSFFTSKTIQRNRLLRAYPQTTGVTNSQVPVANGRAHSLTTRFERRMSKGYSLNASWVWMNSMRRDTLANEFQRTPSEWLVENNSRPHRITMNGIAELPFGKGRAFAQTGLASALLGGWQVAGTYEFQLGGLLNWGNLFYYGDLNTINEDLGNSERTLDRWFNTGLPFEKVSSNQPVGSHVRVFPLRITGVRADNTNFVSGNLQREFAVRERYRIQCRVDVLNALNRSNFNGPNTTPTSTDFGRVTSQSSSWNRFLQFQVRLRF